MMTEQEAKSVIEKAKSAFSDRNAAAIVQLIKYDTLKSWVGLSFSEIYAKITRNEIMRNKIKCNEFKDYLDKLTPIFGVPIYALEILDKNNRNICNIEKVARLYEKHENVEKVKNILNQEIRDNESSKLLDNGHIVTAIRQYEIAYDKKLFKPKSIKEFIDKNMNLIDDFNNRNLSADDIFEALGETLGIEPLYNESGESIEFNRKNFDAAIKELETEKGSPVIKKKKAFVIRYILTHDLAIQLINGASISSIINRHNNMLKTCDGGYYTKNGQYAKVSRVKITNVMKDLLNANDDELLDAGIDPKVKSAIEDPSRSRTEFNISNDLRRDINDLYYKSKKAQEIFDLLKDKYNIPNVSYVVRLIAVCRVNAVRTLKAKGKTDDEIKTYFKSHSWKITDKIYEGLLEKVNSNEN